MRENKEKQALGDLMIKPVQRIPRYELLVKVNSKCYRVASVQLVFQVIDSFSFLWSRTCSSTPPRTTQTTLTFWVHRGTLNT